MAIDVLSAGEGNPLVDACGLHIVAGNVILNKTDIPRALLIALGDGVGGQWDACEKLYYHGEELDQSKWHFHPGAPSSGLTDPVQGVDSFFPAGLTYSHTPYIAVQFGSEVDDVDPAGIVGRYRTKQLPNYDSLGAEIGRAYSSNPARWAAYNMIVRGKISPSRINWPSWCTWRDMCDVLIPWNDGISATPRNVKRFEAHVGFTNSLELIDALNLLTDITASVWQDDGEQIYFRPLFGQPEAFIFDHRINIIERSVSVFESDVRLLPSRQSINFRNLDSEFLAPATWYAKDQALIDQVGIRDAPQLSYGGMTYSQAMRISQFRLNMAKLVKRIELRGDGSCFKVLPGDIGTIVHPAVGNDVRALCLDAEDEASNADTKRFVCAILDNDLYSDTDHGPIPASLQVPTTPVVE